jgi:protein-L-isoaspartate O-methyltransferase
MNWLQKVIAGGPGRPTRFHTERGEFIGAAEMRHLPAVAYQFAATKLTGRRPDLPWWPMPVIPLIADHLKSSSLVLEFGSGSSTVWLAKRCRRVLAIEDHAAWQQKVKDRLLSLKLLNAEVRLATGADYYDLSEFSQLAFDLIIVDGSYRWKCVENALELLKPGGILYLDNSDADKDAQFYSESSEHHLAQNALEAFAIKHPSAKLSRHSGLLNGEIHAGEGMILKLP